MQVIPLSLALAVTMFAAPASAALFKVTVTGVINQDSAFYGLSSGESFTFEAIYNTNAAPLTPEIATTYPLRSFRLNGALFPLSDQSQISIDVFDDQTQSFPIDFISLLPTGDDSEGVFLELPTDTFSDEALTSLALADGAPILPGFSGLLDGVDALYTEFSSIRVALVPVPASLPLLLSASAGLALARGHRRRRDLNTVQESTP